MFIKSKLEFKSLPNNKILDQSKLKAFADDKLKVIQRAKIVVDTTENIVGKEKNAGHQHNAPKRLFLQGVKSLDCVVKS